MANIVNDRDEILSAAASRLNVVSSDNISVVSSATTFVRNGTTVTPSSITLSFQLNGRLYGTPTITYSGVSTVSIAYPTDTLTEVTIQASNILTTVDSCSVTATLVLWGNTYTVTGTISDNMIAPDPVAPAQITIAPEGTLLRMSWPKSPEFDVAGYEVRAIDSGWGTDSAYLYNGSVTSCTVTPGTLGVAKTFYIRVYDTAKKYSTTSSKSYTVVAPVAPTGLAAEFSTTSATTSTCTISWTNASPLFGFSEYIVDLTIPLAGGGTTAVQKITNTPSLVIVSSWVGTASATVKVKDQLGNTSAASSTLSIEKSAPGDITGLTAVTVGNKIKLDWNEPTRTSLPVIGYEVRTADSGWGNTSYEWKGLVSECQVNPPASGATTYYVKSIDSDNKYSTNSASIVFTKTASADVTQNTISHYFSTTSTGGAAITFKWGIPAPSSTQFAIQSYRITLTKPDASTVTADVGGDSWTTSVDWDGAASFSIKTVDILGSVSTGVTYTAYKIPVNVGTVSFTSAPLNNSLEVSWDIPSSTRTGLAWTRSGTTVTIADTSHGYANGTSISITGSSSLTTIPNGTYTITSVSTNAYTITAVNTGATSGTLTNNTAFSLSIARYELRDSTDTIVIYRGSALKTAIPQTYLTSVDVSWTLRTIDSSGKYSANYKTGTYTIAKPGSPTSLSSSAVSDTTSNITYSWAAPTVSGAQFNIQKYRILLTRTGKSDVTSYVTDNFWSFKPDWVDTAATLKVYSVDVLGFESVEPASLGLTINKPDQPGSIAFTTSAKNIILKWPQNSKSSIQLPIAGYEIRDTNDADSLWGTTSGNLIWRGSSTTCTIPATNYVTNAQPYDFYIKAYDTQGNFSLVRQSDFTVSNPTDILAANISYTYDNSSVGGTTVNVAWTTPSSTYAIDFYTVTLTRAGKTDVVIKTTANSHRFDVDWTDDATVTVKATDLLGNQSSIVNNSKTLTKTPPGTPTFVSVVPVDSILRLTWGEATAGSIGIAGYEVRSTINGWGDSSFVWKGVGTSADIKNSTVGDKVWYVKAYDLFGKYSTNYLTTTTYTVTAPGTPAAPTTTYSDTETTSAQVTFKWSSTKNTFDIAEYDVSLAKPGTGTVSATLNSNSWTTEANWIGDATLTIVARDIAGNISSTRTATITKTRPAAPAAGTHTTAIDGITFNWAKSVAGSLGVQGYAVFATTPADPSTGTPLQKGPSTSYLKSAGIVEGNNTVVVYAYDTDGKYSSAGTTLTQSVSKPSTPTFPTDIATFSESLTNASVLLKWNTPTNSFGIDYYDVSFTTTSPALTRTSRRYTTDWEIPATWTGNTSGTLSVVAVDKKGLTSTTGTSAAITKALPSTPGAGIITKKSESGTSIVLDWPDLTKTTLPIAGYVLRSTVNNGDPGNITGLVFKGNTSTATVDLQTYNLQPGGSQSFYLYSFDTSGAYSAASSSYIFNASAPVNTSTLTSRFEDTNLTSATVVLTWSDTTPAFGLKHYEITEELPVSGAVTASGQASITVTSTKGIHIGDTVTGTFVSQTRTVTGLPNSTTVNLDSSTGITSGTGSVTFVTTSNSNSTTTTLPADWLGSKTFRVKTVNTLGWKSTGTTTSITKNVPGIATNFRAQVIDNTVLLYWQLPTVTSLPIAHALIKKGAAWATAEVIGEKSGSFTTVTELQGGTFTYWIAIVDTDNNQSTPVSLTTTVSAPPDYIFNAEYKSTFAGTKSNAKIEPNTGALILPVDLTETFQAHFTARTWAGPSAQVSAGYPVYIQPGLTTGYYEETFDYGTTLGASQVSLSINGTTVVGTITRDVTISTSANGTTWTDFVGSTSAFATNFRYIKVRITCTQATAGALYKINSLLVRLDAKQRTDSGSVSLILGGAQPQYNVAPDYYTAWVSGATSATGFGLNGSTAENLILTAAGPSGLNETLWACIDADVASDAEGGWEGGTFTVDSTKPYLFAVFMKTTTNNGTSYWGTHTNAGDTLSLAGVANTNPYFWNGDLPALNTWYLVVGYIHESGYGTTAAGIGGVYNLTGTNLLAGTEFKFPVGATTAMHRSYHYYNATNSGQQVQYMARPVVIQCTPSSVAANKLAEATTKINYLLTCATKYGMQVTPATQFVDVTSITATPQGTSLTTPVVDFYDIPNPKRFNIFNYDSTGNPVAGTVSWTVRGY